MQEIQDLVKQYVSSNRYEHSVRVADTARKLAQQFKVDEEDAYLVGLVHDIAKQQKRAWQQEILQKYNLEDYDFYKIDNIHHAYTARELLKPLELNEELIKAIEEHVEGSCKPSKLSQVLYIADFIEPGRTFETAELIRNSKFDNLDQMYACVVVHAFEYITNMDLTPTNNTKQAYEQYKEIYETWINRN